MKKILIILLILSLTLSICAYSRPSENEIQNVRNVSFEGTELTVTLGTNKSTGYEWDYEIIGECIEPSINRVFKVIGSNGEATGEVSIGFTGKSEGLAVITFFTPNGWDGTGEGDGFAVYVMVDAEGKIVDASGDGVTNIPSPAPEQTSEQTSRTSITIEELAEGTYKGTMSGDSFTNNSGTIDSTYLPADIEVTIGNGQITLYCETTGSADGMLFGVPTPHSPDFRNILSGSLPLQQSGDAVIAEGEVSMQGENITLNYANNTFTDWSVKEYEAGKTFICTVRIAMENGVPVATITANRKDIFVRTATVPLALKGGNTNELLSAPYAEMLKSGNYQYSYRMINAGINCIATVAIKDGMSCRQLTTEDGTYNQRVVRRDGKSYLIDNLTGVVTDYSNEGFEMPPDYGTLTFVAANMLPSGAVGEAYDYSHHGTPSNIVFVFSEGKLVELVATKDGTSAETFIIDMTGTPDMALFELPQ